MAEFEYRWALGWITSAALDANDNYLLTNWPLQSDQFSIYLNPWGPPSDEITTFPQYTRYGTYVDRSQWSDGFLTFQWGLAYLTEGMVSYAETTIWNGVENAQMTVKTRLPTGSFGYYQCIANKPKPNVDYKRGVRGVWNYIIHFEGGTPV